MENDGDGSAVLPTVHSVLASKSIKKSVYVFVVLCYNLY